MMEMRIVKYTIRHCVECPHNPQNQGRLLPNGQKCIEFGYSDYEFFPDQCPLREVESAAVAPEHSIFWSFERDPGNKKTMQSLELD